MRKISKDGSINETMIITTLNGHYYKDLNPKWKKHMKRMFKNIEDNDYIIATYYEHKDAKPDIVIYAKNRKVLLSIKSGHAPTMHEEPIKTFFDFLRSLYVPERIIKIIAFYHYGYSLTKRVSDHVLSREEIIERFPKQIKEVNNYFRKHAEIVHEIVYRSIIRGRLKRDLIDYFYYGSPARGFLLSSRDIITLITTDPNEECESICFGSLTYVSRARNKNKEANKHRLKINWPVLCKWYYDEEFMKRYGW